MSLQDYAADTDRHGRAWIDTYGRLAIPIVKAAIEGRDIQDTECWVPVYDKGFWPLHKGQCPLLLCLHSVIDNNDKWDWDAKNDKDLRHQCEVGYGTYMSEKICTYLKNLARIFRDQEEATATTAAHGEAAEATSRAEAATDGADALSESS